MMPNTACAGGEAAASTGAEHSTTLPVVFTDASAVSLQLHDEFWKLALVKICKGKDKIRVTIS
jgi:hypothetical protein